MFKGYAVILIKNKGYQMTYIYNDAQLPAGTICTERLYDMLNFKEYKGFIFKCIVYCRNRNISLDQYIDDPKYLSRNNRRIYFLPIELAIGITENVRMSNPTRGSTLSTLYKLNGQKIHVQLHERKAEELISFLQRTLATFSINTIKEYSVIVEGKGYRIDLYVPKYKLAIEYDEYHHVVSSDEAREQALTTTLECAFIRLLEGDTLATNVSKVLKHCLVPK